MELMTNLRALRLRHRISLMELAGHAGISLQYVSQAELGNVAPTVRLETQLSTALETVISCRKEQLRALESDYMTYKGNLLKKEEYADEQ